MKPRLTKAERRRRTNLENLVRFFGDKDKYGRPHLPGLERFEPARFLKLARLYLELEWEMELVFRYVRKFRKAAGEIDESDVREALAEIQVRAVMES